MARRRRADSIELSGLFGEDDDFIFSTDDETAVAQTEYIPSEGEYDADDEIPDDAHTDPYTDTDNDTDTEDPPEGVNTAKPEDAGDTTNPLQGLSATLSHTQLASIHTSVAASASSSVVPLTGPAEKPVPQVESELRVIEKNEFWGVNTFAVDVTVMALAVRANNSQRRVMFMPSTIFYKDLPQNLGDGSIYKQADTIIAQATRFSGSTLHATAVVIRPNEAWSKEVKQNTKKRKTGRKQAAISIVTMSGVGVIRVWDPDIHSLTTDSAEVAKISKLCKRIGEFIDAKQTWDTRLYTAIDMKSGFQCSPDECGILAVAHLSCYLDGQDDRQHRIVGIETPLIRAGIIETNQISTVDHYVLSPMCMAENNFAPVRGVTTSAFGAPFQTSFADLRTIYTEGSNFAIAAKRGGANKLKSEEWLKWVQDYQFTQENRFIPVVMNQGSDEDARAMRNMLEDAYKAIHK